jgi:hypothetical protein
MPIRINFLAEQQEADEMRRRDPLKRAIAGAVALVVIVLGVAGWLWSKGNSATGEAKARADTLASLQKDANLVLTNQARITDLNNKLKNLEKLAASRTLLGSQLNALQNCAVDDVQVQLFRISQSYEESIPKGPDGKPRPAVATERISLTISGRDTSRDGEGYNKFRDQLQNSAYLKDFLSKKGVTLQELSKSVDKFNPEKSFVTFTLVAAFQEKVR